MTGYRVLSTLVLLLSGWLAGAESASWALLQPVVARLVFWVLAAVAAAVLLAFTLAVNVPINQRTLTWDAEHPPEGWRADRQRWHTYQGVRALLLGVWFLCAVGAVTLD